MIKPTASFKENLQLLPAIGRIARIDLVDGTGAVVASIENAPGKAGSVAVYNYLLQAFGALTQDAAVHGLEVFGEHSQDARMRPGAHPNIDRLIALIETGNSLEIRPVAA